MGSAEQYFCARSRERLGDHDPRSHEFTIPCRAFGATNDGSKLGAASLTSLCGALLEEHTRGGLVVVGGINIGSSIEPLYNGASIVELPAEKCATAVFRAGERTSELLAVDPSAFALPAAEG